MDEVDKTFQDAELTIDDARGVPSGLNDRAAEVWLRVAPDLQGAGRLKATDTEALKRYCDLVGTYWTMSEKIATEGETMKTPTIAKAIDPDTGKEVAGFMWRRHPLLSERRAVSKSLSDLEDRFGMNPRARAELVGKLLGRGAAPVGELPGMSSPSEEIGADGHTGPAGSDPANFH